MAHRAVEVKNLIRHGAYAWPGGYPIYFVTIDGEPLSHKAVQKHARDVLRDTLYGGGRDWHLIGAEINWEDANLFCAETGERIESAYAEDEAMNDNTPTVYDEIPRRIEEALQDPDETAKDAQDWRRNHERDLRKHES